MSTVSEKLKIISDALEKIRKVLVKKGFFTDNIYPNITEYADYIDNWNGVNATDLINYIERKIDMPGYIANGLERPIGGGFYNNSFITTFEANDMTDLRLKGDSEMNFHFFDTCENLRSIKLNAIQTLYFRSDSSFNFIKNCPNLVNIEFNSLKTVVSTSSSSYFYGLINNCDALQNITLPSLNDFTGREFINGCDNLTSISLPVCKKLGDDAFVGCKNLKIIDAPLLEEIGNNPFGQNPGSMPNLDVKNGNIFPSLKKITGNNFLRPFNTLEEINMPNLEELVRAEFTFYELKMVTRVNLPKLREINKDTPNSSGGNTFYKLEQLTSISLPSLKYLNSYSTFSGCSLLSSISMPKLETLDYEYYYDRGLVNGLQVKELDLPSLKTIKERSTNISAGQGYSVFGRSIKLNIPSIVTMIGNLPLRGDINGKGTVSKTGWNNYTANNLETFDIYYYSPFYYESSLTWVDFPALKEIICRSTTAPSSLFLNTGLKRFWLPKNTIKTITAQTLTQAPFYNLGTDFEIWTDFASEEELNEANVPGGSINFGQYWANISSDQTATIRYGKTHEEYREEVARLDGGTVKPEFDEVTE